MSCGRRPMGKIIKCKERDLRRPGDRGPRQFPQKGPNAFNMPLALGRMGFPLWGFIVMGAPRKRDSKGGNQGGGIGGTLFAFLGVSVRLAFASCLKKNKRK